MSAPTLKHILPLVGKWRGQGKGVYPGITPFEYSEEVTFSTVGAKPFLTYIQKTCSISDAAKPMHGEMGYLRAPKSEPGEEQRYELAIAQTSGTVTIEEGYARFNEQGDLVLELKSNGNMARTTSATKPYVTEFSRTFTLDSKTNQLHYKLAMATQEKPLQHHLEAILMRV
ncbi:DUF1794-domain-containing protein [Basidiobolus meristosporus CBS 931.73]|uniref:DUF1794-domain-containing protein n=1 Tax=Basidiobolus meristosporus CBS 931.73 TaxID=1314790 RepID=A0A1Y1YWT0_9FUNG|nr:DUF1794-domain-containing protein [Basidiobolus meristosporus CBS 931.73]|eukprot:ORY02419.1 DUF1794-domain-containing protein [Basidiobolus meristosporus CBS 931.73]